MYDDFDDEVFLAPETTVSLHFDTDGDSQDWDVGAGEAREQEERNAWARHPLRADSAGDYDDEDRSRDLRDAIRHMLTLTWD